MMSHNKSVLRLGIGTLFAQVLSLISLPIITHMYSPTDYGYYNLLILITIVLLPISTLKLETTIVTSKKNIEKNELMILSVAQPIFISVISFPITFAVQYYNVNSISKALMSSLFMSILLITLSYVIILTQIALKFGEYKTIAISGFLQNFITYFIQILLGFYRSNSKYLIYGFAAGRIIGALPLIKTIKKVQIKLDINVSYVYILFKKYLSANKFLILTSVIEALIYLLPSLASLYIFGIRYSGYIGFIQTLLLSSVTLIGGSYGSVLFSEVAKITNNDIYDKELVKSSVLKIFRPLFLTSILYGILIFTMGGKILSILLNKEWADSSRLLTWLALPFAISILWRPITILLFLTKNWKQYLFFTILNVFISIASGYIAFFYKLDWKVVTFSFFAGQSFGQIIGSIFIFNNYIKSNKE